MNIENIVANAFISDLFSNNWNKFSYSELKHLSNVVDYNRVPDGVISDNIEIRKVVRWDRLDKMKLIRILIRCIDRDVEDLEEIKKGIKKYDYKIKDLTYLFMRKPELIEFFPIDLDKINTIDAALLLSFGSEYFLDKIDFSKHNFNFRESMSIIVGYKYGRSIIEKVNYKYLKGYQVSKILINTAERDLDILDISSMNSFDWISLLEKRPNMIKYCDLDKFKKSDIFNSIKLYCMIDEPDLSSLILDRNIDEISPLGWEILLIKKPEKFLALCNFEKLEEINWVNILSKKPEFSIYKENL